MTDIITPPQVEVLDFFEVNPDYRMLCMNLSIDPSEYAWLDRHISQSDPIFIIASSVRSAMYIHYYRNHGNGTILMHASSSSEQIRGVEVIKIVQATKYNIRTANDPYSQRIICEIFLNPIAKRPWNNCCKRNAKRIARNYSGRNYQEVADAVVKSACETCGLLPESVVNHYRKKLKDSQLIVSQAATSSPVAAV